MAVTSFLFLVLALVASVIFRILPQKYRAPWLLLISVVFLGTWNWTFMLILALFGITNYWLGFKVEQTLPSGKRLWLLTGILLNILVLFVFKYNHFFLPSFLQLLGIQADNGALQILLPVGLSFLVVQMISYLVDVANKRLPAEHNLISFGVYTLYFPKLLSGPVERARIFLPSLQNPLPFDRSLLNRSLSLIILGVLRKLVFANPLFSLVPQAVFTTPLELPGQNLWLYLFAYAFALFNDFAGYTGIVRGISLWFGIEMSSNFNLPYFSRNFTEFWNRWHSSLSAWLRDYLFFPISRSLMKRFARRDHILTLLVPPMATMLVSGLWHGVSWSLLVWGGLHGLYLVLERLPGLFLPSPPLDERPLWRQLLGMGITFLLTLFAWIPFRMDLPTSLQFFKGLFIYIRPDFELFDRYITGDAVFLSWTPLNLPNPLLILLLAAALVFDLLLVRRSGEKDLWSLPRWVQAGLIVILFVAAFSTLFVDAAAPFVYQAF